MAAEAPDTWRSKLSGSADRRGIPLGTIVVAVAVVIALVDLNVALILGLWALRTIVVYIVIAFFFTLLLTPATRFLKRQGMSHGGATLPCSSLVALALIGLVYLFTEPLVTAAVHFGHQIPTLVSEAKKGRGPLGRLVFRLHLQKYLSQGSSKITSKITKVLKPATAFSVGAAAVSTLVAIVTDRHPHLLHHARGAAHVVRLPEPVPAPHRRPPAPGGRRVDPLGDRVHARELRAPR